MHHARPHLPRVVAPRRRVRDRRHGTMGITSFVYFVVTRARGAGRCGRRSAARPSFCPSTCRSSRPTPSSSWTADGSHGDRSRALPRDDDVEDGARAPRAQPREQAATDRRVPRRCRRAQAASRLRNRRVHVLRTPRACRSSSCTTGSTTRCSTRPSFCSRSSPRLCPRSGRPIGCRSRTWVEASTRSRRTTGSCRRRTCRTSWASSRRTTASRMSPSDELLPGARDAPADRRQQDVPLAQGALLVHLA